MLTSTNSYLTEQELFSHIDTRLNAEEFAYINAVLEVIGDDINVARLFDKHRSDPFSVIETALADAGYTDPTLFTEAFNALQAGETQTQKHNQQAAILATRLIDELTFSGSVTSATQSLQWPRTGCIDRNGTPIAQTEVPQAIKTATAELALFLLRNDITDESKKHHLFALTSERVGETQATYSKRQTKRLPDVVMDTLKPFLAEQSTNSTPLMI